MNRKYQHLTHPPSYGSGFIRVMDIDETAGRIITPIRPLASRDGRAEIGADALGIPLLLALIILVLSVSYQVVKGTLRNPAETIRAEYVLRSRKRTLLIEY